MALSENGSLDSQHTPVTEVCCGEDWRNASYKIQRINGSGDWLLIYTKGGSGHFVSSSGVFKAQIGDIFLYGPGDFQDYSTDPETGEWHLLWTHFPPNPRWELKLQWTPDKHGFKHLHLGEGEVRDQFCPQMDRMIGLSRRELPGALDLASNALEAALLWADVATAREQWLAIDSRVRKAIDHLIAHLREPFVLRELAAHCGLSVSRLAYLFKRQTGSSPSNSWNGTECSTPVSF